LQPFVNLLPQIIPRGKKHLVHKLSEKGYPWKVLVQYYRLKVISRMAAT